MRETRPNALKITSLAGLFVLLGFGVAWSTPGLVDQKELEQKALIQKAQEEAAEDVNEWETNSQNETEALGFLWSALKRTRTGARVYYGSPTCQGDNHPIPFPKLAVKNPVETRLSLSIVQNMFAADPQVKVREGETGMISITIGDVPKELLQTQVHQIDLETDGRFTPEIAVMEITRAKAVSEAEKKLNVKGLDQIMDVLVQSPLPGLPHLPRMLKNVTLDHAFDMVAKTVSGVVVFGYCVDKRRYDVDFTGGYNYDDGEPVIRDQSKQNVRH